MFLSQPLDGREDHADKTTVLWYCRQAGWVLRAYKKPFNYVCLG